MTNKEQTVFGEKRLLKKWAFKKADFINNIFYACRHIAAPPAI